MEILSPEFTSVVFASAFNWNLALGNARPALGAARCFKPLRQYNRQTLHGE